MRNTIIQGDALAVLKTLPDQSVNMCVTSPPYYALRDYGTTSWIGGDPNCDHKGAPIRTRENVNQHTGTGNDVKNSVTDAPVKQVCPKCGAVRVDDQIGLEETPEQYIERLVAVFHEVKRVLRNDGTLWVNIGDSYSGSGKGGANYPDSVVDSKQATNKGSLIAPLPVNTPAGTKPKDLIGIPWMLAFALRSDGWYLRQDIIWQKPNPMPESVTDRCTKSHEYIFLLSKSAKYYYDADAIKEPTITKDANLRDRDTTKLNNCPGRTRMGGLTHNDYDYRNKRDVWSVSTVPYAGAHFATFPEKLIEPCILAGTSKNGGVVLDCFSGAGTTGVVCARLGRKYIGIELNPEYVKLSEDRIANVQADIDAQNAQYCLFTEETNE